MKKKSLLTFSLSCVLILSSCGLHAAPDPSSAGPSRTGNTTSVQESPILKNALTSQSFQKALVLLESENVKINLNEAIRKDDAGMPVFALRTSRNDLMVYISVPESGEVLTQFITRSEEGHILGTDIGSSAVYEFDSHLQVVRSGWAASDKNLSSLFVMGGQKPANNSVKLSAQDCTVPSDMYIDLYFAQNEAENAGNAAAAAAIAFASADFFLMACFGGPAACAGAVSAFTLAAINLNIATKTLTTANKKVQEQMRRINEWRRTNCS
ncbi:hypothetical protein [Deinococcus sp. JMULE3]|uniref:hypothetical protein n=1 Tax=Deinococcus sp. JMULE3 TaxID=2518341 RepID=UPI001575F086|nr:hypothetical protein [Deinococcus sp. JMULE3]NTX99263.1 hypothetical protein [Deinococcus sp. JMULE3]